MHLLGNLNETVIPEESVFPDDQKALLRLVRPCVLYFSVTGISIRKLLKVLSQKPLIENFPHSLVSLAQLSLNSTIYQRQESML